MSGHSWRQELVVLEVVVARERADRDRVAVLAHVREVGEPADVDEQLGPREPQPHERQQRVAAREELRVLPEPSSSIAWSTDSATS